jgi:ABC-type transporter Mla MlaB component
MAAGDSDPITRKDAGAVGRAAAAAVVSAPLEELGLPGTDSLAVHGPLLADNAAHVLRRLADLQSSTRVLLDLSATTEIDDAGLCAIACIHDRLTERGGELMLLPGRHTRSAVDPLRTALGETLVVLDPRARGGVPRGRLAVTQRAPLE